MPAIRKFKNRRNLISFLPHDAVGAEVGVQSGRFAQTILDNNNPRELWLIDCWETQKTEIYGHDPCNVKQSKHDKWFSETKETFSTNRAVHILRMYTLEAANVFRPNYFDWVYFDANHLQLREDISAWWSLIKPGGWFSGHDYCIVGDYIRVKEVVDEFIGALDVDLYLSRERRFPSWAFRKPNFCCPA